MIDKHPDKLTYWKSDGVDYMGQPSWVGPTTVKCRWEDEQRQYITDSGKEARGRSTIYLPEEFLDIGDYVIEGESQESIPPSGAFEVKQPRKIKNLRGTKVEYRVIV